MTEDQFMKAIVDAGNENEQIDEEDEKFVQDSIKNDRNEAKSVIQKKMRLKLL